MIQGLYKYVRVCTFPSFLLVLFYPSISLLWYQRYVIRFFFPLKEKKKKNHTKSHSESFKMVCIFVVITIAIEHLTGLFNSASKHWLEQVTSGSF